MVFRDQKKKVSVVCPFSRRDFVVKFTGNLIKCGKKRKAFLFFNKLLYQVRRAYKVDPIQLFLLVFEAARPKVFLSSKRVAGIIYKIPVPISVDRSFSTVIRWFIAAAGKRRSHNFAKSIFDEFNDLYKNSSNTIIKKRDEFHKMAYVNKPFLRYYKIL